ncbi:hypothetical protein APS56_15940 [Pseudalgibacter alginicilyticus]|uniref:Uncharacterized protein n=1 Tax=Pseudalgibacter alginicilyticus TaxID=1736674 RepID=A0A0P0D0Q2_9FLAO|nr:hypothetical protein APS56_15940 [Pseudalgibacter alginicilyticus]
MLNLFIAGCSKEDDNTNLKSEYYFRFKVDGNQVEYPFTPETQINLTGLLDYDERMQTYVMNVGGIENIFESMTNTLTIFVSDTQEILTGINYSNISGSSVTVPYFSFGMGYYDSEGNLYITGLNTVTELYETAIVNFFEITDTHISGTFSGTLIWYDFNGGTNVLVDSVVVSEGKFKVPRY